MSVKLNLCEETKRIKVIGRERSLSSEEKESRECVTSVDDELY